MLLKMLLPFLYLCTGFIVGKTPINIKTPLSYLLTKVIIPMVIIYNISTCRADLFIMMFAMMFMMASMLFISRLITTDIVKRLAFFYLNIGWLALPIATALLGDNAAAALISMYIGSSIFGNSIGASLLINDGAAHFDIRKTLKTPPVTALILGVACIPFGTAIQQNLQPVYRMLKLIMSILGMGVLGMWLANIQLHKSDFKEAVCWAFLRAVTIGCFMTLFMYLASLLHLDLVTNNKPALYMLCLLPPAANIIVLETHYCRTGRSAGLIACGTLLSLSMIAVYAGIITYFFNS